MKSFKHYIAEAKLPTIKKGDTILTGKWKNSPAIVKGFGKDKNKQPTVKTNKGTFNLYKFRIKKLMESEIMQDTKTPLRTLKNSLIKRYKNNVGKDMPKSGGRTAIYLHKNYALDLIPKDIYEDAINRLPKGFNFNTIVWVPLTQDIRFDKASNFDTEREPWPEIGYWVLRDGTIKKQINGMNQIWHHKWLWVKDDYKGFDVQEAYNWSKKWLQLISSPSGQMHVWKELLKQNGLDNGNKKLQEGLKELLAAGLMGISALTPHDTMASQKPQATRPQVTSTATTNKIQNKTQELIIRLGKFFVKNGFRVGSHSHFDLNKGYVPEGNQRIGKHTKTSLHYTNRALDVSAKGKSQEEMKAIFNFLYNNKDKYNIHELIYAPSGHYNYKRGLNKKVKGHNDHIHVGFKQ